MRLAIASAILFTFAACAGITARTEVLIPTMQEQFGDSDWRGKGIYRDIRRGIDAQSDPVLQAQLRLLADDLADALEEGDIPRIVRVDWQRLMSLAELGISARVLAKEIGEGVALSYRERLRLFTKSFNLLKQ